MTRWRLAVLVLVAIPGVAAADDPPLKCAVPPADTKLVMTFKPDVAVADLATWLAGVTCKAVVFDSNVTKRALRVTVVAPNKYTPKQAVELVVDAIEATGLVVTQKPDRFLVKLGPNMPRTCPDIAVAPAQPPVDPDAVDPTDPNAEIIADIKEIDATHRTITRKAVDKVVANPMAVMKGARVVPAMKGGKPQGLKLYAIRPSSVFAKLGFANGDTVLRVNGFELTSADKALEVYEKLRTATRIEIEIERRGAPLTLQITVK